MYFVYIIQSLKDKKFYTGITSDLEKRLSEHNNGRRSTKSTVNRGPFKLVYSEKFSDRSEAREREVFFKSGAGRELRSKLISKYIPR